MVYAQPGHGRRSNLYTDYTFGVWHGGGAGACGQGVFRAQQLARLPSSTSGFVRTRWRSSGRCVRWSRSQVFELAYEGIAASSRHKSGIALRFPRILRWRTDKPASEADTLAEPAGCAGRARRPSIAGRLGRASERVSRPRRLRRPPSSARLRSRAATSALSRPAIEGFFSLASVASQSHRAARTTLHRRSDRAARRSGIAGTAKPASASQKETPAPRLH